MFASNSRFSISPLSILAVMVFVAGTSLSPPNSHADQVGLKVGVCQSDHVGGEKGDQLHSHFANRF